MKQCISRQVCVVRPTRSSCSNCGSRAQIIDHAAMVHAAALFQRTIIFIQEYSSCTRLKQIIRTNEIMCDFHAATFMSAS